MRVEYSDFYRTGDVELRVDYIDDEPVGFTLKPTGFGYITVKTEDELGHIYKVISDFFLDRTMQAIKEQDEANAR